MLVLETVELVFWFEIAGFEMAHRFYGLGYIWWFRPWFNRLWNGMVQVCMVYAGLEWFYAGLEWFLVILVWWFSRLMVLKWLWCLFDSRGFYGLGHIWLEIAGSVSCFWDLETLKLCLYFVWQFSLWFWRLEDRFLTLSILKGVWCCVISVGLSWPSGLRYRFLVYF